MDDLTTPPHKILAPQSYALSGGCRVFVEEVFLAGMPKSSLQGGIYGVFWNKYPIVATSWERIEIIISPMTVD